MGLGRTDLAVGEIALATVTFPAVEEETAMLSGAARRATTGPVHVPEAAAGRRVRGVAGEAAGAEVGAAAAADVVDEHPLVR